MGGLACRVAAAILVLAALTAAALAQPAPNANVDEDGLPTFASGQLGTPTNALAGTQIKLFNAAEVERVNKVPGDLKKARKECRQIDYTVAASHWLDAERRLRFIAMPADPNPVPDRIVRGRARADENTLGTFRRTGPLPLYVLKCPPRVPLPDRLPTNPPLPNFESGDLGEPPYRMSTISLAVFNLNMAQVVDQSVTDIRRAVAACDRAAFLAGTAALIGIRLARGQDTVDESLDLKVRGRALADCNTVDRVLSDNWIVYPDSCE